MLLYPELLSNDQLIFIIKEVSKTINYCFIAFLIFGVNLSHCLQRHLRVENIERMSRCELIELFRNYCVPYGQRKYRDSGRGKVLNKTRHCSPEPVPKLNVFSNDQCNKNSRSNCDRIKPPPDILSGHMKRIKLDSLVGDLNSKRKMSIDSVSVNKYIMFFISTYKPYISLFKLSYVFRIQQLMKVLPVKKRKNL